jgi:O-antigen/teichoic acid export membrane protein
VTTQLKAAIRSPRERVLSGSAIMLNGLALVAAMNFAYNIAVARLLGPISFGHTTAVYTLLILVSAVTLSFQIVTAKIIAQQSSARAQSAVYRGVHWRAWTAGIGAGLLLLIFSHAVTAYLKLADPLLVPLLAIGVAFYVPLGARRGYIDGICDFRRFAFNLALEGFVRLGGSFLLILMGYGVRGVILANSMAVVTAYLFARPSRSPSAPSGLRVPVAFREGLQVAVFFAGQVIINNGDIVLVKHFFAPEAAGIYAAVAMVGRVVFAFCWAIVSSMFPIAAQTGSRKQEDRGVLGTSLRLVLSVCLAFALGLWLAPHRLWIELFGGGFVTAGGKSFPYLMVLYAASTGVYALSVVIIAYEMSRKIANTGWVQLVGSGMVVAGIYLFHSSLVQVIWVQLIIMLFLLLCVAVPFVITLRTGGDVLTAKAPIKLRRRVSEDEVIAEFLRTDFQSPEFRNYQQSLSGLVETPDLTNAAENEVRRALLFLRHGPLWRELPKGTEWFEAEISSSDLYRIRVFPRAHWRKLAVGDFAVTRIARRVLEARAGQMATPTFLAKIERLRDRLAQNGDGGAALIIGLNENSSFTVLDGNHRLVAAILTSPESLGRLRFFCGLSPRMLQCCWYRTNPATLLRYAINLLRNLRCDPSERLVQLLQKS